MTQTTTEFNLDICYMSGRGQLTSYLYRGNKIELLDSQLVKLYNISHIDAIRLLLAGQITLTNFVLGVGRFSVTFAKDGKHEFTL